MQRRNFSLGLLAGLTSVSVLSGLPVAQAQPKIDLQEGKNFWTVKPAQSNDAPAGKILVIEFFSYTCSHCYAFAPLFEKWAQDAEKKDVFVVRVPVSFRPLVEPHAKIYYTLEALKRLDLHMEVFAQVQDKKNYLIEERPIKQFFAENNIDADKAMEIYNSFGIQTKVQRANHIVNAYGIEGTPSVGIAGLYFATGGAASTLVITDELIERAKKELHI